MSANTELDDNNKTLTETQAMNVSNNHLCPSMPTSKWENNKPTTTTTTKTISEDGNNNKNMSQLIRALSWPLISPNHTVCIEHTEANGYILPKGPLISTSPTFQQLMAARRSLCRRYYPEGHWGWCIMIVGTLVNVLTHGLQLSYGVHLAATAIRFGGKSFIDSGEFNFSALCST